MSTKIKTLTDLRQLAIRDFESNPTMQLSGEPMVRVRRRLIDVLFDVIEYVDSSNARTILSEMMQENPFRTRAAFFEANHLDPVQRVRTITKIFLEQDLRGKPAIVEEDNRRSIMGSSKPR